MVWFLPEPTTRCLRESMKPVMLKRYEPIGSCARVKLYSSGKEWIDDNMYRRLLIVFFKGFWDAGFYLFTQPQMTYYLLFIVFTSFNLLHEMSFDYEETLTYQKTQKGINFMAAHRRNTKPPNVRWRVRSYTLLNNIMPRNWEKISMMPIVQNKEAMTKR